MARLQPLRFRVSIRPEPMSRGGGDLPGFLDMLRYEGGRVVDWSHLDNDLTCLVTVEVEDRFRHQPDRWASFGIIPTEVRA